MFKIEKQNLHITLIELSPGASPNPLSFLLGLPSLEK